MSIENVIEKLNCATRCNPNATQVLVSEAIEMLAKLNRQMKQEPIGFIDATDNDLTMEYFVEFYPDVSFKVGDKVYCRPQQVPEDWREAVQEFVNRCDKGVIISSYTYKKFKALLQDLESMT
jgi:ankyrin repeat protein